MRHISKVFKDLANPSSFDSQYSDPRWKNKAYQFRRSCSGCASCKRINVELHVHHINYTPGVPIWEAKEGELVGLCKPCHDLIHVAIRDFRKIASHCNATNIAKISLSLQLMIQKYGDQGTLKRLIRADEFYES